jgi:hypothetical protein
MCNSPRSRLDAIAFAKVGPQAYGRSQAEYSEFIKIQDDIQRQEYPVALANILNPAINVDRTVTFLSRLCPPIPALIHYLILFFSFFGATAAPTVGFCGARFRGVSRNRRFDQGRRARQLDLAALRCSSDEKRKAQDVKGNGKL